MPSFKETPQANLLIYLGTLGMLVLWFGLAALAGVVKLVDWILLKLHK